MLDIQRISRDSLKFDWYNLVGQVKETYILNMLGGLFLIVFFFLTITITYSVLLSPTYAYSHLRHLRTCFGHTALFILNYSYVFLTFYSNVTLYNLNVPILRISQKIFHTVLVQEFGGLSTLYSESGKINHIF